MLVLDPGGGSGGPPPIFPAHPEIFLGIVKEMDEEWILGGVRRDPLRGSQKVWVGGLAAPPSPGGS